jgi:hypothetical protein
MHGARHQVNRREIVVRHHRVGVVRCRTCSGSRGERVGCQRGAPGCWWTPRTITPRGNNEFSRGNLPDSASGRAIPRLPAVGLAPSPPPPR